MIKAIINIFNPEAIKLNDGREVKPPKTATPYIVIGLIVAMYISAVITGFEFSTIIERGGEFFELLGKMARLDFSYAADVITPLLETIKMSLIGSLVGCILAVPVAILSSVNINKSKIVLVIVRIILSINRTLPTLVIALIATYIFGLGAFAGTVAIAIFTFGLVVKMLYEKIETVDMGPFEAMEAAGATRITAFIGSIMPQILPSYLSICLYTLEINVRYAAILGYVGAGGIGLIISEKIGWREYEDLGMLLFMLFVTVVIIEQVSKKIRERLG